MTSPGACCAVTGTGGYVGSIVARALERGSGDVLRLSRTGSQPAGARFTLEEGVARGALEGAQALVHAAWDFSAYSRAEIERNNVAGSIRLFDHAAAAGVERLVFVSSLSAFPGCRSMYGRAKLAVEEHVLSLGGAVVRPGLVWGTDGGSLYATLAGLARKAPVLPVFAGESRKLHLAHEDDLAGLVVSLVEAERVPAQPVAAAAAEPLSLADILRRIAAAHGRRLRIVHVPWRAAWAGLRALELAHLDPPFRSDSVVSLISVQQRPFGPEGAPAGFRPFMPDG